MQHIPQGYKNTELGIIPMDWEVKTIGEIFNFYPTANYSKAEMAFAGEIGCVHYGLIHSMTNPNYSLAKGTKFYTKTQKPKYELVKDGDVIMVDASEDLIGINKSVEIFGVNSKKFIAGLHTYLLRDSNLILANNFRGQILNGSIVKRQMLKLAVGMKVFGVSKPQLKQILVPIPPLPEQIRIAQILSDADALLQSLDVLIAKKKALKQGLMQELLTPKEGWEVKKLGDYVKFQVGYPFSSIFFNQNCIGKRLIKNKDLKNNNLIVYYSGEFDKSFLVKNGDVLISMDGEFMSCIWNNGEALLNQRVGKLAVINKISIIFLYFYIQKYLKKIEDVTAYTTVKHLSHSDIENIYLPLPPLSEQTRIATILSDADAEISALEAKREKYARVKEGLMHSLLTGKMRV